MHNLEQLRTRIDELDGRLVELLNERAKIALEIGALKEREGLPVYVPEREEQLLRRIEELNPGPLTARSLRAIYREIMSASLSLEKNLVVAVPNPSGGPCHQAAVSKFGSSVDFSFYSEIADVFAAVEASEADCGVVPVETGERGAEAVTLDSLARHELSVCAEIASPLRGEEHAGDRYFVIGRTANSPSGQDRSFLLLRIEDKPGALVAALEPGRLAGGSGMGMKTS